MRRPLALLLVLALAAPSLAQAAEYKPRRAGHPLRIVGYALHPVGYILDRLVFYPAWWMAQWEPLGALVGMKRTVRDVEVMPEARRRYPNVLIEIGPARPPERAPAEPPESGPE